MKCSEARYILDREFFADTHTSYSDELQVHLVACPACRGHRDELEYVHKAFQRDPVINLPDSVALLLQEGCFVKEKWRPSRIQVFALVAGLLILALGWAALEYFNKSGTEAKEVEQDAAVVAATPDTDPNPHPGPETKGDLQEGGDQGSLKEGQAEPTGDQTPGKFISNFDQISKKLSHPLQGKINPQDVAGADPSLKFQEKGKDEKIVSPEVEMSLIESLTEELKPKKTTQKTISAPKDSEKVPGQQQVIPQAPPQQTGISESLNKPDTPVESVPQKMEQEKIDDAQGPQPERWINAANLEDMKKMAFHQLKKMFYGDEKNELGTVDFGEQEKTNMPPLEVEREMDTGTPPDKGDVILDQLEGVRPHLALDDLVSLHGLIMTLEDAQEMLGCDREGADLFAANFSAVALDLYGLTEQGRGIYSAQGQGGDGAGLSSLGLGGYLSHQGVGLSPADLKYHQATRNEDQILYTTSSGIAVGRDEILSGLVQLLAVVSPSKSKEGETKTATGLDDRDKAEQLLAALEQGLDVTPPPSPEPEPDLVREAPFYFADQPPPLETPSLNYCEVDPEAL